MKVKGREGNMGKFDVGKFEGLVGNLRKVLHGWSTYPPPNVPPPEIAGLIKGLLTIGFP